MFHEAFNRASNLIVLNQLTLPSNFKSLNDRYIEMVEDENLILDELRKGEEAVFFLRNESVTVVVEIGPGFSMLVNTNGEIQIGDTIYQICEKVTNVYHVSGYKKGNLSALYSYEISRNIDEFRRSNENVCTRFVNDNVRSKLTGIIGHTTWQSIGGMRDTTLFIKTKVEKKTGLFGAWIGWSASSITLEGALTITNLVNFSNFTEEFNAFGSFTSEVARSQSVAVAGNPPLSVTGWGFHWAKINDPGTPFHNIEPTCSTTL